MSSLEPSPGEGDIAEELAAAQRSISIAEFFEKNKHMLGFDSGARALVTAVKEAVDNALDATEEAGILPDIFVKIEKSGDYYKLVVEDNGPGITKDQIPNVFGKMLYGSRFHVRSQNRGQQGIGISAAVLYAQLTSGKPARITSRTQGSEDAQYFELIIDTDENEPEIREEGTTTWDRPHGTRIEIEMEANLRARQQLLDYIEQTAVVNPHARIEFHEPKSEPRKFERATEDLPKETEEIRPHPHGVELGTVIKMLKATDSHSVSGFLQEEFTRVGRKSADEILDRFRDHHFGREMTWEVPGPGAEHSIAAAVADATANKGKSATEAFAEGVEERLREQGRVAHHEVSAAVDEAAEAAAEDFGTTFGRTVRENAVAAAWDVVVATKTPDLFKVLEDATSDRKDRAVIEGWAERLAEKFDDVDDPTHRLGRDEIGEFVERAASMTADVEDVAIGETARENVIDAVWDQMETVPDEIPKVREIADDRDAAGALVAGMRETSIMAPPTDCLAPITADLIEAGLRKEYDADFYASTTRDGDVYAGDPFVVEAGIAYGGELEDDGTVDLLRFANRVPLVYQRGACATTDVARSIGWRNYELDQPGGTGLPHGPAVIMVHVASTNVPFTSESKDAVANIPEIEDEIELAIRESARELKSYLNKRRSMQQRREKRNKLATILPEMAEKLSEVTGKPDLEIDDSIARIMNNVLVEREFEDGEVRVTIENNTDRNADLEMTDIVTVEPVKTDGARVTEMDGEWFLTWDVTVSAGEETTLVYTIDEADLEIDSDGDGFPDGVEFDLSVDGVEDELLTVSA